MEDFLRTFVARQARAHRQPGRPHSRRAPRAAPLHLGQRKGIGVASNLYKQAYVVVAKRHAANELVIAIERPDTPLLWARRAVLNTLSTTGPDLHHERQVLAQPRYRTAAPPARFRPFRRGDEWCAELEYETPQRALTPGQICALYEGDRLLGGAVFESIEYD